MPVSYRPSLGAAWVTAAGSPAYRLAPADRSAMPAANPVRVTGVHAVLPLLAAPTVAVRFAPHP